MQQFLHRIQDARTAGMYGKDRRFRFFRVIQSCIRENRRKKIREATGNLAGNVARQAHFKTPFR